MDEKENNMLSTILAGITFVSVIWLGAGIGIYVSKWLKKAGEAEENQILDIVDGIKETFQLIKKK